MYSKDEGTSEVFLLKIDNLAERMSYNLVRAKHCLAIQESSHQESLLSHYK